MHRVGREATGARRGDYPLSIWLSGPVHKRVAVPLLGDREAGLDPGEDTILEFEKLDCILGGGLLNLKDRESLSADSSSPERVSRKWMASSGMCDLGFDQRRSSSNSADGSGVRGRPTAGPAAILMFGSGLLILILCLP